MAGSSVADHMSMLTQTVAIEVNRDAVQHVYASPDLPDVSMELIDFDGFRDLPEEPLL